jgi:hypothetical protein
MNRNIKPIFCVVLALTFSVVVIQAKEPQRVNSESVSSKKGDKQQVAVFASATKMIKGQDWAAPETLGAIEDALHHNGLQLVARHKLEVVEAELARSLTAQFDQSKAIEVGKLLSAKYLIAVDIQSISAKKRSMFDPRSKLPGNKNFRGVKANIRVRVIDAETGRIKETLVYDKTSKDKNYNEEESEETILEAYRELIAEISTEFAQTVAPMLPEARSAVTKPSSARSAAPDSETAKPTETPTPSKDKSGSQNEAPPEPEGQVVSLDGLRVIVEISGVQVGQQLEIYSKRERIDNQRGELLGYDYKQSDRSAKLRVVEVRGKLVTATVEQTYDLKGAPDPKPRPDRLVKFHLVKPIN